jgi:uncharacterized membrane protein
MHTRLIRIVARVRARPRMTGAALFGLIVALLPLPLAPVTRALVGWNAAVWLYLVLIVAMMRRADHARLRRTALAHAEGSAAVLTAAVAAAAASVSGIVVELARVKVPGAAHALPHVLFAAVTVAGAWLLLPVLFTLAYASAWHAHGAGLRFPDTDAQPHYGDFAYVAFTIAVASQTADVAIASPAMRHLVLAQSLLSFGFNTAILALSINIAAGLV